MGEALIHGMGSGGAKLENYFSSTLGSLSTINNPGSLSKDSWTRIGVLKQPSESAIAYGSINFNNSGYEEYYFYELDIEFSIVKFSTYGKIFIVKMSKDTNGCVNLYMKLSQSAPWTALNWDPSYYRMTSIMIPIN